MWTKFIIAVLGLDVPDSAQKDSSALYLGYLDCVSVFNGFQCISVFMDLHSLPWNPCKHLGPQHPVASSA